MAISFGAPSLEGLLKDLEERVAALESAPPPMLEPKFDTLTVRYLEVGQVMRLPGNRRVHLDEVVIAAPGSGTYLINGSNNGYYTEKLIGHQSASTGPRKFFSTFEALSEEEPNEEG